MRKSNFSTRKCIICKQNKKKYELTRLIINNDLNVIIDNKNRNLKRGYYFCNTQNEIALLLKKQFKVFKNKINNINLKEDNIDG